MSHSLENSTPSEWGAHEIQRLRIIAGTERKSQRLSNIGRTALWNAVENQIPSLVDEGSLLLKRVVEQKDLLSTRPSVFLESSLALSCAPIMRAWASGSSADGAALKEAYRRLAIPIQDIMGSNEERNNFGYLSRAIYTAIITRQEQTAVLVVPALPGAYSFTEGENPKRFEYNSCIAVADSLTACQLTTQKEKRVRPHSQAPFIRTELTLSKALWDIDSSAYSKISHLSSAARIEKSVCMLGGMIIDDTQDRATQAQRDVLAAITQYITPWPLTLAGHAELSS